MVHCNSVALYKCKWTKYWQLKLVLECLTLKSYMNWSMQRQLTIVTRVPKCSLQMIYVCAILTDASLQSASIARFVQFGEQPKWPHFQTTTYFWMVLHAHCTRQLTIDDVPLKKCFCTSFKVHIIQVEANQRRQSN